MKRIPLTQGKVAVVDDDEFEELAKYKWYALSRVHTHYAVRKQRAEARQIMVSMHRVVLDAKHWQHIDHVNGNGLDNRRANLRICTRSQNSANCYWHNGKRLLTRGIRFKSGRWEAYIRRQGKILYLGRFTFKEQAAKAYDRAAIESFGEFARLNYPQERETTDGEDA